MTMRGRPLTPEVKKAIVSVKHYFDEYVAGESIETSIQRTASDIGVGEATAKRVMADHTWMNLTSTRIIVMISFGIQEKMAPGFRSLQVRVSV